MFHVSDGLYFERLDDGSVRVSKQDSKNGEVIFTNTMDADSWASVVSSMSKGGEIDNRFYSAREFHQSTGAVTVTPTNAGG